MLLLNCPAYPICLVRVEICLKGGLSCIRVEHRFSMSFRSLTFPSAVLNSSESGICPHRAFQLHLSAYAAARLVLMVSLSKRSWVHCTSSVPGMSFSPIKCITEGTISGRILSQIARTPLILEITPDDWQEATEVVIPKKQRIFVRRNSDVLHSSMLK